MKSPLERFTDLEIRELVSDKKYRQWYDTRSAHLSAIWGLTLMCIWFVGLYWFSVSSMGDFRKERDLLKQENEDLKERLTPWSLVSDEGFELMNLKDSIREFYVFDPQRAWDERIKRFNKQKYIRIEDPDGEPDSIVVLDDRTRKEWIEKFKKRSKGYRYLRNLSAK